MVTRNIANLKNWDKNPRGIKKDDFNRLVKSIQKYGQFKPLLITEDGTVLGGNMRLKAYQQLGIKEVWVSVVDAPDTKTKLEYALADNDRVGYYEEEALAELVLATPDFPIEDFKVDLGKLTDLSTLTESFGPDPKEDIPPELDETSEPVSRPGEVYQLGRHRLMCGDSTKIEDVEKLMDGKKADMVFTDPPYGMKKENEGVLNDNLNYADLLKFNKEWIPLTFSYLKENGSWYCWGIAEPLMDIYSHILKPYIKENKITFRNWITWDKYSDNPTMRVNGLPIEGFRMYYPSSEFCLFVMTGVQGFNTNQDNYYEAWEPIRQYLVGELEKTGLTSKDLKPYIGDMYGHYFTKSQWTIPTEEKYEALREASKNQAFKKDYQEIKKDYQEIKKDYYATRAYFDNQHEMGLKDTWRYSIDDNKEMVGIHATPKPIALCSRAIKSSSRENEIVMDVFGGSGSTLIACEQTNRTCYMMELDAKYCDVIRKRYHKFVTGAEEGWQKFTSAV